MFACYEDMVKKQARTPAPPLRTPLLIMIILEDNYPVICRRDSPEKAFSRSRLAASLCEQGQWSRERRQAGMQRGAGGPSPEWPGSLGDLRHPGLCCLHNTHTHTQASESYALFFFFFLSLFAAGLFDLCVPGLFAVVSILPWSKPYYLEWCCSVIYWKRAVEYSSGELQYWAANKGTNNVSPVYLDWLSERTEHHFACDGYGLFQQLLPLLLVSLHSRTSLCICIKQRSETVSICVGPVEFQQLRCCNSHF